jgi:DtxR family Mn-dependent transcriptional regulator
MLVCGCSTKPPQHYRCGHQLNRTIPSERKQCRATRPPSSKERYRSLHTHPSDCDFLYATNSPKGVSRSYLQHRSRLGEYYRTANIGCLIRGDWQTALRMREKQMITVSKEDYLKAIAEAEAEGQTVIAATLSHWLSVTRPAVTFALKRLTKDGLVSVKRDGHIQLTAQGREIAERTIVRHHLIERMLSEIFGMAWYEIHEEAERLEHAVSPAFEKKLVEKLGHKDICPHGNGLALRSPAERRKRGLVLLTEAEAGSKYRVASVYERDRKLLEFFEKEGIRPGARLTVETRNYDGTVSLAVDRRQIRLGNAAAEKVWLSKA